LYGVLATLFQPILALAGDPATSTGTSANDAASPSSSVPGHDNKSISAARWTVSVGGIVLGRLGGSASQTLAARVPGDVPFLATFITPGTEVFNSNQIQQGLSAGPKVSLRYRDDSGFGVELSYFNVFNQSGTASIGPDSPADWLVMRAPGGFWQTQDFPYQAMTWRASTDLYNAEINGQYDVTPRVTVLAGFRWLQLNDSLEGTLVPGDRTAPTWKTTCPFCNLLQVTPGGPIGDLPPFWNAGTTNNLYGVQVGVDGKILEFDRFSLNGRVMFGLFDNHAEQTAGVSIQKIVYPAAATVNGAAFVSEAGLQLRYRVMQGLSLTVGYEVLWLVGVALAPGQIRETYAAPSDVRALGVNHGSNVLFQGATFGLEYSF
jgi:hypothetical protein